MDLEYPDDDDSFKGETVWADGSEFELSWEEEDTPKSTATSTTEPLPPEDVKEHGDEDEVTKKFWSPPQKHEKIMTPSKLTDTPPPSSGAPTNLTAYCGDVTSEETVGKFSPFSTTSHSISSSPKSVPPPSPSAMMSRERGKYEDDGEKEDSMTTTTTPDLLVIQIKFLEDIIRRENGEILRLRSIQDFHESRCEPSLLSHTQPFTAALISYHEAVLKRILIQRHILLLLHATKCLRKEEDLWKEGGDKERKKWRCDLSHCAVAKDLLRHMFACRRGKMCKVAHCFPSRQMIFHWKTCQQKAMEGCQICAPLRRPRPSSSPSAASCSSSYSSLADQSSLSPSSSCSSSPQYSPSLPRQPLPVPASMATRTPPSPSKLCISPIKTRRQSSIGKVAEPSTTTFTVAANTVVANTNGRHGYDLRKTRANGHHDDGGSSIFDKSKLKYFETIGKRDHTPTPYSIKKNEGENNEPTLTKRQLRQRKADNNAQRINQILKMAKIEEAECEEDDPNTLWCICRQPHKNRLMIQCDDCHQWFHSNCVALTKAQATRMEKDNVKWVCPLCRSRVDT